MGLPSAKRLSPISNRPPGRSTGTGCRSPDRSRMRRDRCRLPRAPNGQSSTHRPSRDVASPPLPPESVRGRPSLRCPFGLRQRLSFHLVAPQPGCDRLRRDMARVDRLASRGEALKLNRRGRRSRAGHGLLVRGVRRRSHVYVSTASRAVVPPEQLMLAAAR